MKVVQDQIWWVTSVTLASFGLAPPALSQTPGTPLEEDPSSQMAGSEVVPPAVQALEEIVVTAQRRNERLQDVPISITALTANSLAARGISSTSEVAAAVPGLTLSQSRTIVTPYLRGVGTQNSAAGEEGSVATYVDGVYFPSLSGANFAFNNIERIEVLKGPQGTLFGRNATGGLLQIITKDPSHDPLVDASIGYANYETLSASIYATAGLSSNAAIDFAGVISDQNDGWGRNLTTGEEVNYRKEWAVRSKLLVEVGDFTFRLAGDYNHRNSDIGNSRGVYPGSLMANGSTRFSGSIYDVQLNTPRRAEFEQWGVSLKADVPIGGATLSSTTAYRYSMNFGLLDQDATPTRIVDLFFTERSRSAQQELLLVGKAGRIDYTIGTFLFYANAGVDPLGLRSDTIPAQNRDRNDDLETYSYAGFAQGVYHVTDQTSITAGLRFTRDERSIEGQDVAVLGNNLASAGTVLTRASQSANFDKLTWRAAIDHKLTDDILAYASVSRGFKSGVFNSINFLQPAVRPETLDSFEIGWKSDLFGDLLRLNASAFHYRYKDIQLFRIESGITTILNAAEGRVNGLDVEATLVPRVSHGRLSFTGNMSVLDAEYASFPDASFTRAAPNGGNIVFLSDATGNDMIRTPPLTATVAADYLMPVSAGDLGFNLSYHYNDGFYWDPDNRIRQESYNLVSGSISFDAADDSWRASIFVRNLTEAEYFNQVTTSNLGDATSPGAPRTYGITFGVKL